MVHMRDAGLAMLDVLVALLLLALTLSGACVTLVQAMRASQDALLATRAADLAADFTEDLHGAASAAQVQALLATWRTRVAEGLPVSGMAPGDFASLAPAPPAATGPSASTVATYELRLRWRAAHSEVRELSLPVAATFSPAP